MEIFAKIRNSFKLLTIFAKKVPSQMLNWVENRLLAEGLKYWAHSFPSLQIKPRKYSAGKCVWHRFWKGTKSWSESKQNECLWRSSRPKGSLRKMLLEILHNSQINHLFRNLFFDKVKLCRTLTSLKTSLQRMSFLAKFAKYAGKLLFCRTPPDDCFWL